MADLANSNAAEAWASGDAESGLDDIAAFNTSTPDATNDPDLAFLNTPTTPYQFDSPPTTSDATFDTIPTSVCPPPGPFYASIEPHFPPSTMQPFFLYNHRRSVSEPPADHHMGFDSQLAPMQPQITFHRGGHYLGDARPLKSLPRQKPPRQHPYNKHKPKQGQRQPLPPRQHIHRSQTMPEPAGPTSAPRMYDLGSDSSTRVCTPEPTFDAMDPGMEDVFGTSDKVMLEMTREELKNLITEAVQKAIEDKGSIEPSVEV